MTTTEPTSFEYGDRVCLTSSVNPRVHIFVAVAPNDPGNAILVDLDDLPWMASLDDVQAAPPEPTIFKNLYTDGTHGVSRPSRAQSVAAAREEGNIMLDRLLTWTPGGVGWQLEPLP